MARKERQIINIPITITGGSVAIPIWSANTIYTKSFDMSDGQDWSVSTSFGNAATASCAVTTIFEQGWQKPDTEGASDATMISATATTISCGPISTWRHATLTHTEGIRYGRFKVSGSGLNTASIVTIVVHKTVEG